METLKSKKSLGILAAIVIGGSALLVSCGGGGGNGDRDDNPGFSLPPHPGAAGKVTLEGVDSDNDGVRDDVQIEVYDRHPNDESKRNALLQDAVATQAAILAGNSGNEAEISNAVEEVFRSIQCNQERFGDIEASSEMGLITVWMVNTTQREEAYFSFNEAMNGSAVSSQNFDNPCN